MTQPNASPRVRALCASSLLRLGALGASLAATLGLGAALGGCGGSSIPNTDVPDTEPNREVVEFVERYRHAVEAMSAPQLLTLVSEDYFDDNGTPQTEDDVDYGRLRDHLARWTDELLDVRYEIRYRRVHFETDRVTVDFTYSGRFKLRGAEGERWERRLADDRIELVREHGEYRIISGM